MIGRGRERDPISDDDLAALDDLQDEVRSPPRRPTALIVPVLITMIVMAGGMTIAWYSYNAGVKEGSEGAAPLLKPSGPMKVAPDNPGGTQIPHKNITVYQSLNEKGQEKKVERILPPPERPLVPPTAPPTADSPPADATGENSRVRAADKVPGAGTPDAPGTAATPQITAPAAPSAPAPEPKTALKTPTETAPTATEQSKPTEREVRTAPVKTPAPAAKPPAPKVAAIPKGAYRVQIGSVSTEAQAGRLWNTQSAKSGGLLAKLSMNVEKTVIKGKSYYRVQAGPFSDAAGARALCDKLKGRQIGCFVVHPKR